MFLELQQIIGIVIRQVNLPATNLTILFVDGNNCFCMIAASRRAHLVEHIHIQMLRVSCHLLTVFQNLLSSQIKIIQGNILVFVDRDSWLKLQGTHATTSDKG